MSELKSRLTDLKPSLVVALESEPEKIAEFDTALAALQALYQVEIIGRLELSRIFNDVDGD